MYNKIENLYITKASCIIFAIIYTYKKFIPTKRRYLYMSASVKQLPLNNIEKWETRAVLKKQLKLTVILPN
jgi:hypothetical protein